MGCRFSVVEAPCITELKNRVLKITDFDGKVFTFDAPTDYEFPAENKTFDIEVLAYLRNEDVSMVIRRNGLCSVFKESTKLLLDVCYIDVSSLPNNDSIYRPMGYYYTGKEVDVICYNRKYQYAFLFDIQRRVNRGMLKVKKALTYTFNDAKSFALASECLDFDHPTPKICINNNFGEIDGGDYFEEIHSTL